MSYNEAVMRLRFFAACAGATLALAACAVIQDGELKSGSAAPEFAGKTVDGKEVTLKGLTKDKPVFLVYWKERCPHNPRASALFNSLNKAYEGKAQLVGIVWTPQDRLEGWSKQFSINHPLIADADKSIIGSYGLSKSIGTYQIGTDGKIVKLFPGYGIDQLKELNEAMAKAAGVPVAQVDLSSAPNRLTWG